MSWCRPRCRAPLRRIAAADPKFLLAPALHRAGELIEALALTRIDRPLLLSAGALAEPALRTLDAIHVASALDPGPLDLFVTYDERQAAAARLAGPQDDVSGRLS